MKVGVVGLGLIGGSMAKAVKKKTEHEVIGWDASETIRYSALLMKQYMASWKMAILKIVISFCWVCILS